jgi:hypothetical protein
MSERRWFKRWRNGDRFDAGQEHHGGRRGSSRLRRVKELWQRRSLEEREWRDEERSARYQSDPCSLPSLPSDGLF